LSRYTYRYIYLIYNVTNAIEIDKILKRLEEAGSTEIFPERAPSLTYSITEV